jgi:hypothetical protein
MKLGMWPIIATILTLILAVIAITFALVQSNGNPQWYYLALFGVSVNISSGLLAFVVGSLLLKKDRERDQQSLLQNSVVQPIINYLSIRSNSYYIGTIPWKDLIDHSIQIDFVVQGWDGWFDNHSRELKEFFTRGGTFRLFVYHPTADETSISRAQMASRTNKSPGSTEEEIKQSVKNLKDISDNVAGNAHKVQVFYMKTQNWYFLAKLTGLKLADGSAYGDVAVLSPYSHKKHAVNNVPAHLVSLASAPEANEWITEEIKFLTNHSELAANEPVQQKP